MQRQLIYFPERYSAAQQNEWLHRLQLDPWPSAAEVRGMTGGVMPDSSVKGTVVVFHGNAGSAPNRIYYIAALRRLGYRVILAEYPGYGARSGEPSEAALVADAITTTKLAAAQFPGPLFLCGESLGAGVATGVVAAQQVEIKGLLLITPFDSLPKVAQHHFWFLLARWLVRDKFDNIANLAEYRGSIAVILAEQDEVIPNERTQALYDALAARKKLWRFPHAGHNSMPLGAEQSWWREAMQFIDN